MKPGMRYQFIAMFIGFVIINVVLFNTHFINIPDGMKGFIVGIGIAIIASPIIFLKLKRNKY